MAEKVVRIEDILEKENRGTDALAVVSVKKKKTTKQKPKKAAIPKGVPKSGRIWKSARKRFSSIVKTGGIRKSNAFEKLLLKKEDIKRAKALTRNIVEERQGKIELRKQRRRDNMKRQAENQKKSEVVQVIKNTAKIKRMKKKQLRSIEKRDTLKSQ